MLKTKLINGFVGTGLIAYACAASAKTIIKVNIGNPPPPNEKQYEVMPPPVSERYSWIRVAPGQIPPRAVMGGRERDLILYICQAPYRDGIFPGKLVGGRCNITYGGAEIPRDNYRLLVGQGLEWRMPGRRDIPRNAIPGGFERGQNIYICRARYDFHGVHPGKVVAGVCRIGYGGREIPLTDYEILVSH